ncbi:FHA domain-containing protein [Novipirellula caenicola]|uniref:FHA domain-containing protein n=1 Tax=Novipirellula caenicola TaxID=1536901 RepID=A0ABP9VRR4_9BACT
MTHHQRLTWTIGSDRDCSVVVTDADVKPLHCELRYEAGIFTVLPRQGRVGFAKHRSGLQFTDQPQRIVASDRVYLTQSISLPWPCEQDAAAVLTVGRASDCDLILDYPEISGRHAILIVGSGGTRVLRDTHSRNGLYVDADFSKHVEACLLNPNRPVYFGSRPIDSKRFFGATRTVPADETWTASRLPSPPIAEPIRRPTWILASTWIGLMLAVLWTIYLLTASPSDTPPLPASQSVAVKPSVAVQQTPRSAEQSETIPNADPETPSPSAEPVSDNVGTMPPSESMQSSELMPPSEPARNTASTASATIDDCVYWVLILNDETHSYFRLGTAIATDDQILSTTGSIVHALTKMQQNGYSHPKVVHLATMQEYAITASGVLPEFEKRVQTADLLRQQYMTQHEAATNSGEASKLADPSLDQAARLVNLAMTAATSADVGWLKIARSVVNMSVDRVSIQNASTENDRSVRPVLAVDLLDTGFDQEDPFFDSSEKTNLHRIALRVLGQDPEYDGVAGALRIRATANEVQGRNLLGAPVVRNATLLGLVVFQSPPDEDSAVILEVVTPQTIAASIPVKSKSTP